MPQFKISRSDLLEDETIKGNIYFNKPYNFKIEQPGEEWKILTGSQAAKYNSDAVVVIEDKLKKYFAMVIVDKLTGLTLEDYFNLIKPVEDKNIKEVLTISKHKTTVNNNEALRVEFEIKINSTEFRFIYYLFDDNGQKFQVVLWTTKTDYLNAQESFDLIKDSFDFIDQDEMESQPVEVKPQAGRADQVSEPEAAEDTGKKDVSGETKKLNITGEGKK
ncbi:MAG: hypothetical protein AAB019_11920 [Planctomycetota bacterium]